MDAEKTEKSKQSGEVVTSHQLIGESGDKVYHEVGG